jgi:hydroxyacylglutathione hydrolase
MEPEPMTIFGVREYVEEDRRICFIDARTRQERLDSGIQIPEAISIPPGEIEDYLDLVPRDCPVVTYCESPDQANSKNLAKVLMSYGWENIHPLQNGFEAWVKAGYEVEKLNG